MTTIACAEEVAAGERFKFGENWSRFLSSMSETRIQQAIVALQRMLGLEHLRGRSFLDIGSGSGLSSLAARRMGAQVHSLDYDPACVACTESLRDRYFPGDDKWTIEQGSALDEDHLSQIGKFDVVYSWGVLHHTGQMWQGLKNAMIPLRENGILFVAIYNHQFGWTKWHTFLKRCYNRGSFIGKGAVLAYYTVTTLVLGLAADLAALRNPLLRYRSANQPRGMTWWAGVVDWAGGYPFETARPEEIFGFLKEHGCQLQGLKTCGNRQGCNEFVFRFTPPENR